MASTDVPSGASQYLSKARELSIRLYKKSAEVTWKFQHFLRHLTTGVSVNAVTRAYVLLLILILVAGNTRAVVSPFQSVEWFWIIISCITFGIFNFNANRLSSNEFTIQSMTAGYAILLFLYGSFAIWPSSLLVQLPLVMELIGIFTLLFLSSVAGCLTGAMVQTSSLGDSFFRHHILPHMKDSNSQMHLLHWAIRSCNIFRRHFVQSDIICKVPANTSWGSTIFHNVSSAHDFIDVGKRNLSSIRFSLKDAVGNTINLNGASWSLSLVFAIRE